MFRKNALFILFAGFVLVHHCMYAQKRWAGGNRSVWNAAASWQPAGIPDSADDVVLDNSLVHADYKVLLPDSATVLHSLTIAPAKGSRIELILPSSSKHSNAFRVKAAGDAIIIKEGGVFRNSSGLTSGQSLRIGGSLRIENEGRYVHNTRALHATELVGKLSRDTGTERGIFEFDIPGGASAISISNRRYGRLVLSAYASEGQQTYNGTGSNSLTVRSDLEINEGVRFNMGLTRDVFINGNFIQRGGTFNLASRNDSNTVKIQGDLFQADSGIITETARGLPVLEMSGNRSQQVSLRGKITDSVSFRINNPHGVVLSNRLLIPYRLELLNGRVKSSETQLLALAADAVVSGGSDKSFIEGPVEKIGNGDFEFPVGKSGDFAPVKMIGSGAKNDIFRAEYFLQNPGSVYGADFENPPIARISTLEYWKVERQAGTSVKKLDFSVREYSQATALDKLVVARWDNAATLWKSAGNFTYSGNATGNLVSNDISVFGIFTLGSTVEDQNPLPLELIDFRSKRYPDTILFLWKTGMGFEAEQFELESSPDGNGFKAIRTIAAKPGVDDYTLGCPDVYVNKVAFRLKVTRRSGLTIYSRVIWLSEKDLRFEPVKVLPSIVTNRAELMLSPDISGPVQILVIDMACRRIKMIRQALPSATNTIPLDLQDISPGIYIIQMYDTKNVMRTTRFIKR